jgi:hypothetical protein
MDLIDAREPADFYAVPEDVYRELPHHRSTEDDVMRLLIEGPTAFRSHADVHPCLLVRDGRIVGRVAFIQDRGLPEYVMASYFEALPGLDGVGTTILDAARARFPSCPRIVIGLHGHLNYGAGFLVSRFDQPPVFGLPYTPAYYLSYFSDLPRRTMVSYRFENGGFYDLAHSFGATFDPGPVSVRDMDRSRLDREVGIYTALNNACFQGHPYWSDRSAEEDLELFRPFRFLIKEENLIFAEVDGRPIGFLLWYPDFNELATCDRGLGPWDVVRYHLANPIRTVRLTEIAVLPEHRRGPAVPAMILRMIRAVERGGYRYTEGGFIFEENRGSMGMTLKFLAQAFGREPEPYRRFCVFDDELKRA